MGSDFKSVRAQVVPADVVQRFVKLVEAGSPEEFLVRCLREYAVSIGYSGMFPNFKSLRIGTVHPFAILLAADVFGTKAPENMFPSITVADLTTDESQEVLGDDVSHTTYGAAEVASIEGLRAAGEVYVSDEGMARINALVSAGQRVAVVEKSFSMTSTATFNVWADNKDITSFLFDAVCDFLHREKVAIHAVGYDLGAVSGNRSGDINLDFGQILYGASVRVPVTFRRAVIEVDAYAGVIESIDVKTQPTFHAVGE